MRLSEKAQIGFKKDETRNYRGELIGPGDRLPRILLMAAQNQGK